MDNTIGNLTSKIIVPQTNIETSIQKPDNKPASNSPEKNNQIALNNNDLIEISSNEKVEKKDLEEYNRAIKNILEGDKDEKIQPFESEIRELELHNGEIIVKVYDQSGKMIRMIPPGYVPAGEQSLNVII